MFDAALPEEALRALILALPVLLMLVLLALLLRRRGQGQSSPAETEYPGGGPDGESAPRAPRPVEEEKLPAGGEAPQTVGALEEKIGAAGKAGEVQMLANLYLLLGRAHLEAGDEAGALAALRSAAGVAARHGPARIHGEARMELAEAALRAGDPTGACEQWQMARMAFLDAGSKAEGEAIDRRMRASGCPTDWVLTDF